jgi:tetratricopeptide (TPR) repeat protein
VGSQSIADRYTYLPSVGVCLVVVWTVAEMNLTRIAPWRTVMLAGAPIASCLFLTAQQLPVWRDTETLFWRAVAVTSRNAVAENGLGSALIKNGRTGEGVRHLEEALRINPSFPEAHYNLVVVLVREGRMEDAIQHYRAALAGRPNHADARYNLANALGQLGQVAEATAQYEAVVLDNSDHADAQNNLGAILLRQGRPGDALSHFKAAIRLQPNLASAHGGLGLVMAAGRQYTESAAEFRRQCELQPTNSEAHYFLGLALVSARQPQDAARSLREAVRLRPDWASALNSLAWLLATHPDPQVRDGADAARFAGRAVELTGRRHALYLDTYGAALAEAGRFDEAVEAARAAIDLFTGAADKAQAESVTRRLGLYQARQPYRDTPSSP